MGFALLYRAILRLLKHAELGALCCVRVCGSLSKSQQMSSLDFICSCAFFDLKVWGYARCELRGPHSQRIQQFQKKFPNNLAIKGSHSNKIMLRADNFIRNAGMVQRCCGRQPD